jgi:hypothetical protein
MGLEEKTERRQSPLPQQQKNTHIVSYAPISNNYIWCMLEKLDKIPR